MLNGKNITAIILAGGNSSRMKKDKGLMNVGDKALIEYVIAPIQKVVSNIIIITQNPAYEKFGLLCYPDAIREQGALGGIYTGLIHSPSQKNLIVGCDMPFLSENILMRLISNVSDEDVLLTEHMGNAEPLCSIYDKNCITHIRSRIEQNQLKISSALAGLKIRVISFDNEDWFAGNEFVNINSIEELKKYDF